GWLAASSLAGDGSCPDLRAGHGGRRRGFGLVTAGCLAGFFLRFQLAGSNAASPAEPSGASRRQRNRHGDLFLLPIPGGFRWWSGSWSGQSVVREWCRFVAGGCGGGNLVTVGLGFSSACPGSLPGRGMP